MFVIDVDRQLRWARFDELIGDWTDLVVIDPLTRVEPMGGVAAVSRTSGSMEVFAFGRDGRLLWARWRAATGWTPLLPVP